MIVERYIQRPRHVEVQIVGDRHGTVVELGTRECSVQRRYQKMLEEAPAPNLADATREGLRRSAAELARAMRYDSAGTVEYVVDAETGDYFFLEVNTRLQVEHPVTEAVTGIDLVELQIRSADGEPLAVSQEDVSLSGHAFEVRINAEDPAAGFVPQVGPITALRVPDGVRWDSGVERGSEITPYYDSMIAKLIVSGPDREVARRRLAAALDELLVGGITTTAGFHRWLVEQPPFVAAEITTRFLDETEIGGAGEPGEAAEAAALAWTLARRERRDPGPWGSLESFRVTGHRPSRTVFLVDSDENVHEIFLPDVSAALGTHLVVEGAERRPWPVEVDVENRTVAIASGGHTHSFRVRSRSDHWAPSADAGHGSASVIVAPFPAVVTEVRVGPGDEVRAGDVLVVIEAMKMLHSLAAAGPGRVAEVRVGGLGPGCVASGARDFRGAGRRRLIRAGGSPRIPVMITSTMQDRPLGIREIFEFGPSRPCGLEGSSPSRGRRAARRHSPRLPTERTSSRPLSRSSGSSKATGSERSAGTTNTISRRTSRCRAWERSSTR